MVIVAAQSDDGVLVWSRTAGRSRSQVRTATARASVALGGPRADRRITDVASVAVEVGAAHLDD